MFLRVCLLLKCRWVTQRGARGLIHIVPCNPHKTALLILKIEILPTNLPTFVNVPPALIDYLLVKVVFIIIHRT